MHLNIRTIRQKLKLTPTTVTILLAAIVGVAGGFGAIGFKKLILTLQSLAWGTTDLSSETVFGINWLKRLALPAAGGLIVGPMIYFLAREARGHGVPEVISAVTTRGSIIRPVVVLVKALASAVSIASGGSVGREGPIVQIGAAIASSIGQFFRVRTVQLKTLVGCGVAAGIGATFNAPIAGTLFALELIVTDFGLTSFTPIIVSAVTATAIARHYHGNVFEFILPEFTVISLWEYGLYLLLGVLAGVFGWLFSRSLYIFEDIFDRSRIPEWIRPAAGGLIIGGIAFGFPHIMGVGYINIEMMFEGHYALYLLAFLALLKIAATGITIGSGGSGGIFAPSLFIGAMLGGAFGMLAGQLFPGMTGSHGAYALVGMAAVNGACTLAPLSAIIILIELTNNYGLILPLMFTVVMSSYISRKLSPLSIYTRKLARRGIQVHQGEDMNILRAIPVRKILRHDESVISEQSSLEDLLNLVLKRPRNVIFTQDSHGLYSGVISLHDIKHLLQGNPDEDKRSVTDYIQKITPVALEQSLDTVFDLFAESGFDRLPVIYKSGALAGSIIMSDIVRRYNVEITNRNIAIELGGRIKASDEGASLYLDNTTAINEVPVPDWMVGKSIGELELRKKHDISILIVKEDHGKKDPRLVTPGSDYVFREGDSLLVAGKAEKVKHL